MVSHCEGGGRSHAKNFRRILLWKPQTVSKVSQCERQLMEQLNEGEQAILKEMVSAWIRMTEIRWR